MTYTQEELLDIYHRLYCHHVLSLGYHHERIDLILEVAEFANWIATDPYHETTQEMARDHLVFLDRIHQEILSELERDEWPNPCECMREIINRRVELLERYVDELSDDDTEEAQAMWTVYERWLGHQSRFPQHS